MKRFVICGMPRSGTTLLAETLNQRAGVHIGPETHLLTAFRDVSDPARVTCEEMHRAAARLRSNPLVFVTDDALDCLDEAEAPANLSDLLFCVGGAHASDARIIGEKTPRHLEHLSTLLRIDPVVRVVVVIRDPRDVAHSLSNVPWNSSRPSSNAMTWVRYAQLARQAHAEHPLRVKVIRFEDLVRRSDVVEPLLEFLTGDADAAMRTASDTTSTFDARVEPWKAAARLAPDSSRAEAWRSRHSIHDRLVGVLTADLLKRYGYRAPPGSALFAPLARTAYRGGKAARRPLRHRFGAPRG